jgi:hypothetical protein
MALRLRRTRLAATVGQCSKECSKKNGLFERRFSRSMTVAPFKDWEAHLSIKATAVVKKETKVDPKKPNDMAYYASLSVLKENGKPYGPPRYLSEFREVAVLLTREARVTHGQLHERHAAFERGEEISFPLTLESDEAIKKLGFDPNAATT